MTQSEIVPARLGHVLTLIRQTDPHRLALACQVHPDPRRAISQIYAQSRMCLALRVDGHVIAAYGMVGALIGDSVMIWVVATPTIARHAKIFMRACHAEIRRLAETEQRVTALIVAGDDVAIRFARRMGFKVDGGITNGAHLAALETPPWR